MIHIHVAFSDRESDAAISSYLTVALKLNKVYITDLGMSSVESFLVMAIFSLTHRDLRMAAIILEKSSKIAFS